jgi:prepilin-type processing-associated H-X9-DG protein
LLPYVEQTAIYGKYNFNMPSSVSSPYSIPAAGSDSINNGLYNTRLAFLECPTHPQAGEVSDSTPDTPAQFYTRRNAIRTSYFFSTGVFTDYDARYDSLNSDIRQGAFGNDGAAKLAQITDGTSNSIATGEGAGGLFKTSTSYGPWGLTGTHTCCHGRVVATLNATGALAPTATDAQSWTINAIWPANAGNGLRQSYAWTFNSLHTGGAQFAFADGSVHFLSQSLDYQAFVKLAYIHDGNPVGDYE